MFDAEETSVDELDASSIDSDLRIGEKGGWCVNAMPEYLVTPSSTRETETAGLLGRPASVDGVEWLAGMASCH